MAFGITLLIISAIVFVVFGMLLVKLSGDETPIVIIPLAIAIILCCIGARCAKSSIENSILIEQQHLACGGDLGYFNDNGKFCSSNNTIIKMLNVVDPSPSTITLEKN